MNEPQALEGTNRKDSDIKRKFGFAMDMKVYSRIMVALIAVIPVVVVGQDGGNSNLRADAEQIYALANQARAQAGVGRLEWDPALAQAALAHCRRMVQEGPIAHRYGGESDVGGRAAQAGAHFSVIEENVAIGPTAAAVHDEWMHSPGHRANLLSPDVDHVGVAVIAARGVLYAVADYSRAVEKLTPAQVEVRFAELIRSSGVTVMRDATAAREVCGSDTAAPRHATPRMLMRWQGSDLNDFANQVKQKVSTSGLKQAAIGSCPAQGVEGSFSVYRLAVLLY